MYRFPPGVFFLLNSVEHNHNTGFWRQALDSALGAGFNEKINNFIFINPL
jgi:hypothetical protein